MIESESSGVGKLNKKCIFSIIDTLKLSFYWLSAEWTTETTKDNIYSVILRNFVPVVSKIKLSTKIECAG